MTDEEVKAVEMTRRIRDQMYEETKGLDAQDLIQYIRQRSKAATPSIEEREDTMARRVE